MIPTREQELAVLRSVVYASLFDYPLDAGAARSEPDWRARRRRRRSIAGGARAICCRRRSSTATGSISLPGGPISCAPARAAKRSAASCSIAIGASCRSSPNMPFVRMVALSGSLAHLNAEGSADLDLFVITAPHRVWSVTVATLVLVEAAWMAQARLHELRGVGARVGDRTAGFVFSEPDHSPAAVMGHERLRALREVERLRARDLSELRTD